MRSFLFIYQQGGDAKAYFWSFQYKEESIDFEVSYCYYYDLTKAGASGSKTICQVVMYFQANENNNLFCSQLFARSLKGKELKKSVPIE